jgi:hypothetical protein
LGEAALPKGDSSEERRSRRAALPKGGAPEGRLLGEAAVPKGAAEQENALSEKKGGKGPMKSRAFALRVFLLAFVFFCIAVFAHSATRTTAVARRGEERRAISSGGDTLSKGCYRINRADERVSVPCISRSRHPGKGVCDVPARPEFTGEVQ